MVPILLGFLTYVTAASAAAGVFGPRRDYTVGWAPFSIAVGDLNGDGRRDLAVANQLDGTVSILLGKGNGTFVRKADVAVGTGITVSAIGDFNEDGRMDFAATPGSDVISIQLGEGDGTFTSGPEHPVHAFWLGAADFNRDGRLDLAVVQRSWVKMLILLGNGDGTFTTGQTLSVPFDNGELTAVTVSDFNRDARLDLAVTDHYFSDVVIFLGKGNGNFGPGRRFDVGIRPTNIVVADFNRDGRPDIATPNDVEFQYGVSLLMGKGDGTFKPVRYIPIAPVDQAIAIATGDFNGDGRADLATANGGNDSGHGLIAVYLGKGNGTFAGPQRYQTGAAPYLPAAGRFNADARDDLVVPNRDDYLGTVSVFNTR